ncbi:unannotated protein [freshwater metagenome]|uniref:Unannotated protein n=1 Tax=freshwater metagenome TaxID=449393 RepID=A0A6J6PH90_9ZZZZ
MPVQRVESSGSWVRETERHSPYHGPDSAVLVTHTSWMPADGSPTTRALTVATPVAGSTVEVTPEMLGGAARLGRLPPA